jgi:hypothetical protein
VSAPFVSQLRTIRKPLMLADGPGAMTIRVEASDLWETVRVIARSTNTVSELGARVAKDLFPEGSIAGDFVLKFRGWELLDPRATLADCGIGDGAIVLLAYRRRRPVR